MSWEPSRDALVRVEWNPWEMNETLHLIASLAEPSRGSDGSAVRAGSAFDVFSSVQVRSPHTKQEKFSQALMMY